MWFHNLMDFVYLKKSPNINHIWGCIYGLLMSSRFVPQESRDDLNCWLFRHWKYDTLSRARSLVQEFKWCRELNAVFLSVGIHEVTSPWIYNESNLHSKYIPVHVSCVVNMAMHVVYIVFCAYCLPYSF